MLLAMGTSEHLTVTNKHGACLLLDFELLRHSGSIDTTQKASMPDSPFKKQLTRDQPYHNLLKTKKRLENRQDYVCVYNMGYAPSSSSVVREGKPNSSPSLSGRGKEREDIDQTCLR